MERASPPVRPSVGRHDRGAPPPPQQNHPLGLIRHSVGRHDGDARLSTNKIDLWSLMSILVVGSVAFDTIATPSGRVADILGGAATYFSLAASYFTEVRMVAVVGDDFSTEHEAVLKNR